MPKHQKRRTSSLTTCAWIIFFPIVFPVWLILRTTEFCIWCYHQLFSTPSRTQVPSKSPRVIHSRPTTDDTKTIPSMSRFSVIIPGEETIIHRPSISVSYQYDSMGERFLQEAKQFHSRDIKSALPVSFMHYWPSFSDMNDNQLRWYLYWRGQYRKGNRLPTDLSYIFIYSYELLNLVEIHDPLYAAGAIWALWTNYRPQYSKLDHYLPGWGSDLLAIKKDIGTAILWWEKTLPIIHRVPDGILNLIIDQYVSSKRTKEIPQRLFLMPYENRSKSKYYVEHNKNGRLDQAFFQAILSVEDYYLRVHNESIFTRYTKPRKINIQTSAFASAPVGIRHPSVINWGSTRQYLWTEELREFVIQVVRHTENILRKKDRYARKLSRINLPPEITQLLDIQFSAVIPKREPVKIHIDPARASALRKESNEVSQMLASLEVIESTAPLKPLYTDLSGMRKLWRNIDTSARMFIAGIYHKEIATAEDIYRWQSSKVISVATLIKGINDQAIMLLGENLIIAKGQDPALTEDYLDELDVVITESPPEKTPEPLVFSSDSESPWEVFFAALSPPEIALVQEVIKNGNLVETDLETLLRPFGAMASATMDGVNEKSIDAVNHPLMYLDNGCWIAEKEDVQELRHHLFGTAQ
jgi:hypothetical protein